MNKDTKLNELFGQVRNQPVEASFEETKKTFLDALNAQNLSAKPKKVHFLSIKTGLIMIGIIGIVATSLLMTTNTERKENKEIMNSRESENTTMLFEEETVETVKPYRAKINEFGEFEGLPLLTLEEYSASELAPYKKKFAPKVKDVKKNDQPYVFPKLTKEEIEDNHKQKKQMVKALVKFDKNVYGYIPTGSYDFQGSPISVQGFAMQRTEVSNLEYRTFLFDLLIQGRKDDFIKAAPDQKKWTELFGESMRYWQDNYFADHDYDNRPVVNVSREGAEMYCYWFSMEVHKYLDKEGLKKNDYKMNDVRLPFETEWVKAATLEGKYQHFAWGSDLTVNEDGCFLGNFDLSTFSGNIDDCDCKTRGSKTAKTTAAFVAGDDMLIADVKSYNPNDHGIYNLSGNVAEMVHGVDMSNSKDALRGYSSIRIPLSIGGGWMSSEENVKLTTNENYKGVTDGHPNIGFRVVMSLVGKNWQIVGEPKPIQKAK